MPSAGATTELTRSAILAAALSLADARGVEAVTMRRIAGVLGVSQMAAYRHIRTKEEIIRAFSEYAWQALHTELDTSLPWPEQLRHAFLHMHQTHRMHPGLVDILLSSPALGLPVYRTMEHLVGILRTAGFSLPAAIDALAALESYTFGFTVHQRVRSGRDPEQDHRLQSLSLSQ